MSKAQLLLPVPGLIVVACRSGHILPIYTQISTRVGTLITSTDDHSTVSILVSPYHIMPTKRSVSGQQATLSNITNSQSIIHVDVARSERFRSWDHSYFLDCLLRMCAIWQQLLVLQRSKGSRRSAKQSYEWRGATF